MAAMENYCTTLLAIVYEKMRMSRCEDSYCSIIMNCMIKRVGLLVFALVSGASAAGPFPFWEMSHPDFAINADMAFPSTAYRTREDTVFCAFAVKSGGRWDAIDIVRMRDDGRSWSSPTVAMTCPGDGYIADPNLLVWPGGVDVIATFVPKDRAGRFAASQFLRRSLDSRWPPTVLAVPHKYVSGKTHAPLWIGANTVVMGYSYDLPADRNQPAKFEDQMYARAGALISTDAGRTFKPGGDVSVDIFPIGADEPALTRLSDGRLFMVVRTHGPHPYETYSSDGGATWQAPRPSALTAFNSPTALLRLHDGGILRVWDNSDKHRYPLVAAVSRDDCRTWSRPRVIADRVGTAPFDTACYPSMAQTADGTIVLFWWETVGSASRLGMARFNMDWINEEK
jgi:BNR repeat-like domain